MMLQTSVRVLFRWTVDPFGLQPLLDMLDFQKSLRSLESAWMVAASWAAIYASVWVSEARGAMVRRNLRLLIPVTSSSSTVTTMSSKSQVTGRGAGWTKCASRIAWRREPPAWPRADGRIGTIRASGRGMARMHKVRPIVRFTSPGCCCNSAKRSCYRLLTEDGSSGAE